MINERLKEEISCAGGIGKYYGRIILRKRDDNLVEVGFNPFCPHYSSNSFITSMMIGREGITDLKTNNDILIVTSYYIGRIPNEDYHYGLKLNQISFTESELMELVGITDDPGNWRKRFDQNKMNELRQAKLYLTKSKHSNEEKIELTKRLRNLGINEYISFIDELIHS